MILSCSLKGLVIYDILIFDSFILVCKDIFTVRSFMFLLILFVIYFEMLFHFNLSILILYLVYWLFLNVCCM
jgi:hypothetical protein